MDRSAVQGWRGGGGAAGCVPLPHLGDRAEARLRNMVRSANENAERLSQERDAAAERCDDLADELGLMVQLMQQMLADKPHGANDARWWQTCNRKCKVKNYFEGT